jgi:hypothetical protein
VGWLQACTVAGLVVTVVRWGGVVAVGVGCVRGVVELAGACCMGGGGVKWLAVAASVVWVTVGRRVVR